MAPKSDTLLCVVIGICIVYLLLLLWFILRFSAKKAKDSEK